MLHDLIPSFDKEIAALHDMAPSGFIMGFNLTYQGQNTFSTPIQRRGGISTRSATTSSRTRLPGGQLSKKAGFDGQR